MLPKRRILEIYLNIAELGPNGEFGAEAGAQRALVNRPGICPATRRHCLRQRCQTRPNAMRASRGQVCAASPGYMMPARRGLRRRPTCVRQGH